MTQIVMKIKYLIYTILLCVTGIASCQNKKENGQIKTIERMPNSLIKQLPQQERDPQMMFYLEQSVDGVTVSEILQNSEEVMIDFIEAIPEEKISYKYGFGKWTVAQVLQHIISYERIMTESGLKIAGKKVEDPIGYYNQITTARVEKDITKTELLERFKNVRKQTIKTFANFSEEELKIMGIHESFPASPRTLVLCISGHQQHHFEVIEEKYL